MMIIIFDMSVTLTFVDIVCVCVFKRERDRERERGLKVVSEIKPRLKCYVKMFLAKWHPSGV